LDSTGLDCVRQAQTFHDLGIHLQKSLAILHINPTSWKRNIPYPLQPGFVGLYQRQGQESESVGDVPKWLLKMF
jgi:hypothetical protein